MLTLYSLCVKVGRIGRIGGTAYECTVTRESLSADCLAAKNYITEFADISLENYLSQQMYNCDETV